MGTTRTLLLTLGLLASTLVGCASLPMREDNALAGYRQELAKLVEAGVLTKEDEEKFYGVASLEMERRGKKRPPTSGPTTLPTAVGPPPEKGGEVFKIKRVFGVHNHRNRKQKKT